MIMNAILISMVAVVVTLQVADILRMLAFMQAIRRAHENHLRWCEWQKTQVDRKMVYR